MMTSEAASTYNNLSAEECLESAIRKDLLCVVSSLRTHIFMEQLQVKRYQFVKRYRLSHGDAYWGQQASMLTLAEDKVICTIVETLFEQRPQNRGISAARQALANQRSGEVNPAPLMAPDGKDSPLESGRLLPLPPQNEQ